MVSRESNLEVNVVYENIIDCTVHRSCNSLVDLNVKSRKPIPSPRLVHNNNISSVLDNNLIPKDTGAIKKSINHYSNQLCTSQTQSSETIPIVLEERSQTNLKRSNSIFQSLKNLFGSKKQKKFMKSQIPPPIPLEITDDLKLPGFRFNCTLNPVATDLDPYYPYDVPQRRISDPPSYDDSVDSEEQRQFWDFCRKRIIETNASERLEGASAQPLEDEKLYENLNKTMKSYVCRFHMFPKGKIK